MTKPLRVKCPACGEEVIWTRSNSNRPFCSQRCKEDDFISWANEQQIISGNSDYDDILSEDLGN
jgi:hypothetical protein